jgi:hypothetical protein
VGYAIKCISIVFPAKKRAGGRKASGLHDNPDNRFTVSILSTVSIFPLFTVSIHPAGIN